MAERLGIEYAGSESSDDDGLTDIVDATIEMNPGGGIDAEPSVAQEKVLDTAEGVILGGEKKRHPFLWSAGGVAVAAAAVFGYKGLATEVRQIPVAGVCDDNGKTVPMGWDNGDGKSVAIIGCENNGNPTEAKSVFVGQSGGALPVNYVRVEYAEGLGFGKLFTEPIINNPSSGTIEFKGDGAIRSIAPGK